MHVEKRENAINNRLNKTKVERDVDHEQERVDRLKRESAIKRTAAAEKVHLPLALITRSVLNLKHSSRERPSLN